MSWVVLFYSGLSITFIFVDPHEPRIVARNSWFWGCFNTLIYRQKSMWRLMFFLIRQLYTPICRHTALPRRLHWRHGHINVAVLLLIQYTYILCYSFFNAWLDAAVWLEIRISDVTGRHWAWWRHATVLHNQKNLSTATYNWNMFDHLFVRQQNIL